MRVSIKGCPRRTWYVPTHGTTICTKELKRKKKEKRKEDEEEGRRGGNGGRGGKIRD